MGLADAGVDSSNCAASQKLGALVAAHRFASRFVDRVPVLIFHDPPLIKSETEAVIAVIQNGIQIVATWLIFTGNSRDWFHPKQSSLTGT
jgi:hypothetical protein